MRSMSWARWATCALALSLVMPVATADRRSSRKSLDSCTAFDQIDKSEDTLELAVHSTCTIPIDCAISWRVVCAPDSKKRRAVHRGSAKLVLGASASGTAQASAAVCGDDAWTIDAISWACEPSKE